LIIKGRIIDKEEKVIKKVGKNDIRTEKINLQRGKSELTRGI